MCKCQDRIRFSRIYNSLLRTLMLIVFGLANVNNGLTPYISKDNKNQNDDLNRNINQNLIMSPLSALSPFSSTSGFPPSSSSVSSLSSSHYQRASGSSISSFDSSNILMPQNGRQLAKDTIKNMNSGGRNDGGRLYENLIIDTNTEDPINKEIAGFGGIGEVEGEGGLFLAPMYFGTQNSTIVTTQIGAVAHVPCTIHHIGDGVVSWIRKKDYHLLTVGLTTYSSDERFCATHLKHSEDWTLQIKFVQLRDAGVYECQVSTHPPTSIFLHLNVVEARAEISGPPIRYLTPGSTLRLQCRVVQNTEASEFIFWYHDNRMINYDIDRGINVSTEADFQSSELTIPKTRREHSGNFTCVASNTQPASVLVHIFKGDNPAAMYHGHVGSSTKSYQAHLHSIMLIISMGYRIFISYIHTEVV